MNKGTSCHCAEVLIQVHCPGERNYKAGRERVTSVENHSGNAPMTLYRVLGDSSWHIHASRPCLWTVIKHASHWASAATPNSKMTEVSVYSLLEQHCGPEGFWGEWPYSVIAGKS